MATKKTVKKASGKRPSAKKVAPPKAATDPHLNPDKGIPGTVTIRMYCIGTGDCFIIKFYGADGAPFTMMIDCGSCRGDKDWYTPYITDLVQYVNNTIDLLVVTHEHKDHVDGFHHCEDLFKTITIRNAWFAWTEHPGDPGGAAAALLVKRKAMKAALGSAMNEIKKQEPQIQKTINDAAFTHELKAARQAFVDGLHSLADINLEGVTEKTGKPLAGMQKIKKIVSSPKTNVQYLNPGNTIKVDGLKGVRFHVLGPPKSRDAIFKDGKQGKEVFHKNMELNESTLVAKAFKRFADPSEKLDLPFLEEDLADESRLPDATMKAMYNAKDESWRKIDSEWLLSAGTLALRLTSHINNTSLVLAIESEKSGKVLLMPGDAEYASWESWHLIKSWDKKSKDGSKHLVEDLLNRTVFYKVGHHLSYNGTALEKGIKMMPENNMAAMATLDRVRIFKGWKSTMPNKNLITELTRRTGGRFFIMDETDIEGAPSLTLNPATLGEAVYKTKLRDDGAATLYKQYTFEF